MGVQFTLNGRTVRCPDGLTVVGALYHLGDPVTRRTSRAGGPRSLFCGMGVCFECVMTIDGRANVRACWTYVRPGMTVATQLCEARPGPSS